MKETDKDLAYDCDMLEAVTNRARNTAEETGKNVSITYKTDDGVIISVSIQGRQKKEDE